MKRITLAMGVLYAGLWSLSAQAVTPQLTTGGKHSFLLQTDGTLLTWGSNWTGQLGLGTLQHQAFPAPVVDIYSHATFTKVHAGFSHTVAVDANGKAWAWGSNGTGQLGVGDLGTVHLGTPVGVPPVAPILATGRLNPTAVVGLPAGKVAEIQAGRVHTVALMVDGTVWAWGDNWRGQRGDATGPAAPGLTPFTPVQVIDALGPLTGVTAIAVGDYHTIALKADGTVVGWGANTLGELGDGTLVNQAMAVSVPLLRGIKVIAAGGSHSLAMGVNGNMWAWGANTLGQLGDGTLINKASPVLLPNLAGVKSVAAGRSHSLALLTNGKLWAWGDNSYGQLGNGAVLPGPLPAVGIPPVVPAPLPIPTPTRVLCLTSDVDVVVAGDKHTLVLKTFGDLAGWGSNGGAQLGNGTWAPVESTPAPVTNDVGQTMNSDPAIASAGLIDTSGRACLAPVSSMQAFVVLLMMLLAGGILRRAKQNSLDF